MSITSDDGTTIYSEQRLHTRRSLHSVRPQYMEQFATSSSQQHSITEHFQRATATENASLLEKKTSSSAIAEGPRDALGQLKSCQLLHNCTWRRKCQDLLTIDKRRKTLQYSSLVDRYRSLGTCRRPQRTNQLLVNRPTRRRPCTKD